MRRRIIAFLISVRQRLKQQPRWAVALVAVASVALCVVVLKAVQHRQSNVPVPAVPYSELATALDSRQVSDLDVKDGGTRLVGRLKVARRVGSGSFTTVAAEVPKGAVGLADL